MRLRAGQPLANAEVARSTHAQFHTTICPFFSLAATVRPSGANALTEPHAIGNHGHTKWRRVCISCTTCCGSRFAAEHPAWLVGTWEKASGVRIAFHPDGSFLNHSGGFRLGNGYRLSLDDCGGGTWAVRGGELTRRSGRLAEAYQLPTLEADLPCIAFAVLRSGRCTRKCGGDRQVILSIFYIRRFKITSLVFG